MRRVTTADLQARVSHLEAENRRLEAENERQRNDVYLARREADRWAQQAEAMAGAQATANEIAAKARGERDCAIADRDRWAAKWEAEVTK